jgi:hypothetical protein
MRLPLVTLALFAATTATADVTVTFLEGAPKDQFIIENTGGCATEPAIINIDLSGTPAGLIFDTEPTGLGVEVFQPLEIVDGNDLISDISGGTDGSQALNFAVQSLAPNTRISMSIDLDDTSADASQQIMVTGSEVNGISVSMTYADQTVVSRIFENSNAVALNTPDCVS